MTNNNIIFLKELCFEQFKIVEQQRILNLKQFDSTDDIVRNDQSCTELSKTVKMLDKLIKSFIEISE